MSFRRREEGSMPVIRAVGRLGILDPEQIALLQEIFDLACARLDLDPKSAEAENIAQRLVATHQSGTLDRQAFLNSLDHE
ncbi:hypothetical protein [Aliihoeflea sp. PC F10.4]